MKAIIEFQLPEESDDLNLALNAIKLSIIIEEMVQLTRTMLKHEDHSDEVVAQIERMRTRIFELKEEYGIIS